MEIRQHYDEQWSGRRAEAAALRSRETTVSIARLTLFVIAFGLLFVNAWLSIVPAVAFVALIFVHERLVRRRRRAEGAATFYERGIARLDDAWAGRGDAGNDLPGQEHHPYAGDLDLFGRGSLFELISIAVTRSGRSTLAGWLMTPTLDASVIRARQESVREMRGKHALREELAVEGQLVARGIESGELEAWASLPPLTFGRFERIAILGVPIATIAILLLTTPALIGRLVGWTHPESVGHFGVLASFPLYPLILATIVTIFMAARLAPRTEPVASAVERAEGSLALLRVVVERLERETFESPRLRELQQRLRGAAGPASEEIEHLRRLVSLLDARRNQFFALFGILLLWTPNLAIAIDRWRVRSGSHIGDWIAATGEIEALSSLGSFAAEHPSFAMPAIETAGPIFDAQALGHPLIPASRRITNDVRLDDGLRLLVVSGSNMSGKSTLMRSAGIAAVLAMAGAPVCASSLRIAPTAVGASISVHDSLQENASRFYAEILRIRTVIALSKEGPLLFLLDEILAGTNSHDRRIGAEAIIRGLVDRGAIGIVSTHDLALSQIAETLAPRARNVHFEDKIEDGRVVFDYRMRDGVVTRSNALELMRSVGIEV